MNNNNIILTNSLESLHHREFGLQSSKQRVILASHCHERLTKNKGRMKGEKMEEKWIEMDRPELQKRISLALAFCFPLFPCSSASFGSFVHKETKYVSFSFICCTN